MRLRDINFGDVDAKNEILKQARSGERTFFESFFLPDTLSLDEFLSGKKYFVLGLKGTGKTAFLRYLHDIALSNKAHSEMLLFKSHVTEEDRQSLSAGAGFEIASIEGVPTFIQDFKESWKWVIYQRIGARIAEEESDHPAAKKYVKLTAAAESRVSLLLGALFSRISSGKVQISGEALGVALDLGVEINGDNSQESASLSAINRSCSELLSKMELKKPVYILFDELELFYQTSDQFDRDRRIIRDLIYAIAQINADSAEGGRQVFLVSTLRSEVLHSILEFGHEIGRDIDDYGERLDWSSESTGPDHPLLKLIAKKISVSSNIEEGKVWETLFPEMINNQEYYKFILNSSYFRPRDIVRLLRVAREYDKDANRFTTAHFDQKALEYSKQTWLEITEELLASYSAEEISALQRFFLGFNTHFFKSDVIDRKNVRYANDRQIQQMFTKRDVGSVLSDLYRIGVIGNDFWITSHNRKPKQRNRWIFRGNTSLNDSERMTLHKSLWKHLSLVPGTTR